MHIIGKIMIIYTQKPIIVQKIYHILHIFSVDAVQDDLHIIGVNDVHKDLHIIGDDNIHTKAIIMQKYGIFCTRIFFKKNCSCGTLSYFLPQNPFDCNNACMNMGSDTSKTLLFFVL